MESKCKVKVKKGYGWDAWLEKDLDLWASDSGDCGFFNLSDTIDGEAHGRIMREGVEIMQIWEKLEGEWKLVMEGEALKKMLAVPRPWNDIRGGIAFVDNGGEENAVEVDFGEKESGGLYAIWSGGKGLDVKEMDVPYVESKLMNTYFNRMLKRNADALTPEGAKRVLLKWSFGGYSFAWMKEGKIAEGLVITEWKSMDGIEKYWSIPEMAEALKITGKGVKCWIEYERERFWARWIDGMFARIDTSDGSEHGCYYRMRVDDVRVIASMEDDGVYAPFGEYKERSEWEAFCDSIGDRVAKIGTLEELSGLMTNLVNEATAIKNKERNGER